MQSKVNLIWHDCKTDPPKENGDYLLVYKHNGKNKFFKLITTWNKVFYFRANDEWEIFLGNKYSSLDLIYDIFIPIKWAEVDLSGVE